jgi:hypothetical protein
MLYTAVNICWFTGGGLAVLLYHEWRLGSHESHDRGFSLNCL